MNIRNATYHDAPAIKELLEQMNCTTRLSTLVDQLERFFNKNDHQVFICELRKEVIGFSVVHYLPQLAFDGGIAIISYLCIDDQHKNSGIDKELEQHISNQAKIKKCERVQMHCMDWRVSAHQFYVHQGYQEYPKYFIKRLTYGE